MDQRKGCPAVQRENTGEKRDQQSNRSNFEDMTMRDLNYALRQLCQHHRDGSYATQTDRERILDLIAN